MDTSMNKTRYKLDGVVHASLTIWYGTRCGIKDLSLSVIVDDDVDCMTCMHYEAFA